MAGHKWTESTALAELVLTLIQWQAPTASCTATLRCIHRPNRCDGCCWEGSKVDQATSPSSEVLLAAFLCRYLMLIDGVNEVYMVDRDNAVFHVPNLFFPKRKDLRAHLTKTLVDGVRMWTFHLQMNSHALPHVFKTCIARTEETQGHRLEDEPGFCCTWRVKWGIHEGIGLKVWVFMAVSCLDLLLTWSSCQLEELWRSFWCFAGNDHRQGTGEAAA